MLSQIISTTAALALETFVAMASSPSQPAMPRVDLSSLLSAVGTSLQTSERNSATDVLQFEQHYIRYWQWHLSCEQKRQWRLRR